MSGSRVQLLPRLVAEGIGTAFLLAAIVGSGIMAERLSGGNVAIALLANSVATGAALVALIMAFGPTSGAHFNPLVTLVEALHRRLPWREVPWYALLQLFGAFVGVAVANRMFALPLFSASRHGRAGMGQLLGEVVATAGLLLVIWGTSRSGQNTVSWAVGLYIMAAYWFTSSTSFANPVVTLARSATNTFAGIRPADVLPFLIAQVLGGGVALAGVRVLEPRMRLKSRNLERVRG